MADVNVASESSPDVEVERASLEDLTDEQYAHWQMTAELPAKADPPPAQTKQSESSTDTKSPDAPPEGGEHKGTPKKQEYRYAS